MISSILVTVEAPCRGSLQLCALGFNKEKSDFATLHKPTFNAHCYPTDIRKHDFKFYDFCLGISHAPFYRFYISHFSLVNYIE